MLKFITLISILSLSLISKEQNVIYINSTKEINASKKIEFILSDKNSSKSKEQNASLKSTPKLAKESNITESNTTKERKTKDINSTNSPKRVQKISKESNTSSLAESNLSKKILKDKENLTALEENSTKAKSPTKTVQKNDTNSTKAVKNSDTNQSNTTKEQNITKDMTKEKNSTKKILKKQNPQGTKKEKIKSPKPPQKTTKKKKSEVTPTKKIVKKEQRKKREKYHLNIVVKDDNISEFSKKIVEKKEVKSVKDFIAKDEKSINNKGFVELGEDDKGAKINKIEVLERPVPEIKEEKKEVKNVKKSLVDKNSTLQSEASKPKETNSTEKIDNSESKTKLAKKQKSPKESQKSKKPSKKENKEDSKVAKKIDKKESKESSIKYRGKRGVLVIIIDDISSYTQIKRIKSLPFKVTPSIFPPSDMSESTPRLVRALDGHFLVHLPLQSHLERMNNFRGTLMSYDSKTKIANRVKEIRRLFPTAKFINNHTGSIFTANYKASKILYSELIKNGFVFIDSKTTGKSKIKRVAREFNRAYIARDIFLDNTQNVSAILSQLRKGVKIARRRGYAIVIGHPHRSTFQALKSAKDILRGVEVLYIDEFYRRVK